VLDIRKELGAAVRHFWEVRQKQQDEQGSESGRKDAGNRSAVTGGKHADGLIKLLGAVVKEAGIADADISVSKKKTLPCYFRPTKDWDLIVRVGGNLIAVIEVKSHVGSFGNNFNNRVEEALGNATDFWSAYREATFKPSARPWLGYLMMLEDHPKSTASSKPKRLPHYPMRPEFEGVSYARRYEIFCERLVRERLYDAACFIMSSSSEGLKGEYSEPSEELSFVNFAASLSARANAFGKAQEKRS
jgi:hypothetical protein